MVGHIQFLSLLEQLGARVGELRHMLAGLVCEKVWNSTEVHNTDEAGPSGAAIWNLRSLLEKVKISGSYIIRR